MVSESCCLNVPIYDIKRPRRNSFLGILFAVIAPHLQWSTAILGLVPAAHACRVELQDILNHSCLLGAPRQAMTESLNWIRLHRIARFRKIITRFSNSGLTEKKFTPLRAISATEGLVVRRSTTSVPLCRRHGCSPATYHIFCYQNKGRLWTNASTPDQFLPLEVAPRTHDAHSATFSECPYAELRHSYCRRSTRPLQWQNSVGVPSQTSLLCSLLTSRPLEPTGDGPSARSSERACSTSKSAPPPPGCRIQCTQRGMSLSYKLTMQTTSEASVEGHSHLSY